MREGIREGENVNYILHTLALSEPPPHVVVSILEPKV